jgi:4-amino-4-deoxy-L-arabinose transferase-like glycosyltransferase
MEASAGSAPPPPAVGVDARAPLRFVLLLAAFAATLAGYLAGAPLLAAGGFALALATGAARDESETRAPSIASAKRTHFSWREAAGLAAVTLVAFALRAHALASVPVVVHGDEGEMGDLALRILDGSLRPPPFAISPFWGFPFLWHICQAASMAVFGLGVEGLRMPGVLSGTASVVLVYFLGRAAWGRVAGFAAAWLMAVSALHDHFSRLAMPFMESEVFALAVVLCFVLASRPGEPNRARLAILAGLLVGVSLYFYYASRMLPVLAVLLAVPLLVSKRIGAKHAALGVAAFAISFAPLFATYARTPESFSSRLTTVSAISPEGVKRVLGPGARLPRDAVKLARHQLAALGRFFFLGGKDAGDFSIAEMPAFDAVTSGAALVGLALLLRRPFRYGAFAVLVWLSLAAVLGGVVTRDAPSAQRLVILFPCLFLAGGVFASAVWRALPVHTRLGRAGLVAAAAALALFALDRNVRAYFVDAPPLTIGREAMAAAWALEGHRDDLVYLLGQPVFSTNHGAVKFLAGETPIRDMDPGMFKGPSRNAGMLVLAVKRQREILLAIARRFPSGEWKEVRDPTGRVVLLTYFVPKGRS